MTAIDHSYMTRSTLGRKLFGVWGVRDYYAKLEQLAEQGAELTIGYNLIVLASAALATGGLLLDSPAIVIGSMCVAPFLGPSRAVCIGGLFRNRKLFFGGLLKQLFGLLVVGAGLAFIVTTLLRDTVPGVELTDEILLRSMPNPLHVVLSVFIAISAGIAASLALSADPHIVEKPWGELIDVVIGVEIAISLMPPAAVIGISLAMGHPEISERALTLLVVNVLGLDIVGSMLMLGIHGVRPRCLTVESSIRHRAETTVTNIVRLRPDESTINVTLLSPTTSKVHATVRHPMGETHLRGLAKTIGDDIQAELGIRSQVTVETIPFQTYSTF